MRLFSDFGNLCVLLGLIALVMACFLPGWAAERVARVENRALVVAEEILALTRSDGSPAALTSAQLEAWTMAIRQACARRGHPDSDLPGRVDGAESGPVTLGNRHYLFRVQQRPPPPDQLEDVRNPLVLEVFAWPRTLQPPGRTVFCLGDDGLRVYTRNLIANFAGLGNAPGPGAAMMRSEGGQGSYRSANDERWLTMP